MRKIDKDKIFNIDICRNYDEHINLLYNVNYTMLRLNLQKEIANKHGSKISKEWLDKKIEMFSSYRNLICYGSSRLINSEEITEKICGDYKYQKESIVKKLNNFYNTNKNIEDYFDGPEIIDENFGKDYYMFSKNKGFINSERKEEFSKIFVAYIRYSVHARDLMKLVSLRDIFNSLSKDFTREGEKTVSYGETNNRIASISRTEIESLKNVINDCKKRMNQDYKDDKDVEKFNERKELIESAQKQINIFDERLAFANTPKTKLKDRAKGFILDFANGVPKKAIKLKKLVNSVYYHQCEMVFLRNELIKLCSDTTFAVKLRINGIFELIEEIFQRVGGNIEISQFENPSKLPPVDSFEIDSMFLSEIQEKNKI